MYQNGTRLDAFLAEVGFGEIRLQVTDKKLVLVPRQRIQRPKKVNGVRVEIVVDEPIVLM